MRRSDGWTLFLSLSSLRQGHGWQANCGCSSVVERLVANEKVASSTLVTRSSLHPERSAKRGWSECAAALAEADRPKLAKLRLADQPFGMYHVHLLRSESYPRQPYVGLTSSLKERIKEHNEGRSPHTAKFRIWILLAYFAFTEEKTAIAFEKYLKSGSGRAFMRRHFL